MPHIVTNLRIPYHLHSQNTISANVALTICKYDTCATLSHQSLGQIFKKNNCNVPPLMSHPHLGFTFFLADLVCNSIHSWVFH